MEFKLLVYNCIIMQTDFCVTFIELHGKFIGKTDKINNV